MIESPHKHFKLQNIKLRGSSFEVMDGIDDVIIDDVGFVVQSKRGAAWIYSKRTIEGREVDFFDAKIDVGVRLVKSPEESGHEDVIYSIEAAYVVQFEVIDPELSQSDLDDFANLNGAHLVWPYWRQLVSQVLQSSGLPNVIIPLMAPVMRPRQIDGSDDNSLEQQG